MKSPRSRALWHGSGQLDNWRMTHLDRFLLSFVLPRVLSRACPEMVRRSGPEGMKTDCFNTFIPAGARPSMVVRSITGTTVEVWESDGQRHVVPATIELADIDPKTLEVTHFYGLDKVRYEGADQVALGLLTRWPYAWLQFLRLRNAIGQRRFNSRPLVLGERLDVLRDVVNATARGTDAVDALDLMSHRWGYRWADHPKWTDYQQRLNKQLALLAESGELATNDHFGYRPTGLGARTLDDRKDAARKHGSNWWVQAVLVLVTVVGVVFAAAQSGFLKLPTVLDWTPAKAASGADAGAARP